MSMLAFLASVAILAPQNPDLILTAEKTNFVETGDYQEMVRFVKALDSASEKATAFELEYSRSPQGRAIMGLIVSENPSLKALADPNPQKPLVFVQCGIHSGEIEGKDALMMLARKACLDPNSPEAKVLEKVDLLIIPIFSVDAHERRSAFNRANQNGPAEMGWRATANNLNLNRDYVKIDAPEMASLIHLVSKVTPDFAIDNHTTDGGDWQYALMYDVPYGPHLDSGISALSTRYVKEVMPLVDQDGYLTAPYFGGFSEENPGFGITMSAFSPRYSTSYYSTRNIPSLLVETHVLKDYKTRVDATYSANLRTFQWVAKNAAELLAARKDAAARAEDLQESSKLVLTSRVTRETKPFTFKGYRRDDYVSEVTGAKVRSWSDEKVDYPTVIRDQFVPALEVTLPAAYLVPAEFNDIQRLLDLHGIQYSKLQPNDAGKKEFTVQQFTEVEFSGAPYEGRMQPRFRIADVKRVVTLHAGDLLVPVDQPLARLLVHMFEPNATDSLAKWGFFNAFMSQVEYAADYAMEPYAKKMLASDPKLKAEFEERMKDESFAKNPNAILDFFYERSPYADSRYKIHPIIRLSQADLQRLNEN